MIASGKPPAEEPADDPHESATVDRSPRRSLSRRVGQIALIMFASFLVTAVVAVLVFRDRTPRLTEPRLHAARQAWDQHGPPDYRMKLFKLGNRAEEVAIEVRDGQPTAFAIDGRTNLPPRVWHYWTVLGMFDTLEQELAGGDDPEHAFGATAGAKVSFRAQFDPTYGYPSYFLRSVEPDALNSGWRVESFDPL